MFNRKKKKHNKIVKASVNAYNLGIEDALEILELQMYEYGNIVDIRDMIAKIETQRDEVIGEIFLEWDL
jgi:hypothetical protein